MAHNLYFNERTGKRAFMSVKQTAWHGLGTIIQEYPTSSEAIKHAGLDYEVIKSPLFTQVDGMVAGLSGIEFSSDQLLIPDYYATVKTDTKTVLGVVGKDYEVIQNRDAFSFFDSIIGGDGIQYETAGALGKGERIFITARLPDTMCVGKDDEIKKYLFLTTSHDGSGSITAAFTPVRIVCRNTLNAAMGSMSNAIKIRHTSGAKDRLEQAHKVMGITNKLSKQMETVFNNWSTIRITDQEVYKLIQMAMAPNKETIDSLKSDNKDALSTLFKNTCTDVFNYAMEHETQRTATTENTLYGVYNAVTGYYQNVREYKNDDAKVKSILMNGTAQVRAQSAFNICQKVAATGNVETVLN